MPHMSQPETGPRSEVRLSRTTVFTFMTAAYATIAAVYVVALFAEAELRQPSVWIPVKTGVHKRAKWIPAFAGMTGSTRE
ncbi:MAG: hypothetical protein JXB30_08300 [Anaerolineae bacterium]|nr:hypothetical protein [Anaerolineae bacterium]